MPTNVTSLLDSVERTSATPPAPGQLVARNAAGLTVGVDVDALALNPDPVGWFSPAVAPGLVGWFDPNQAGDAPLVYDNFRRANSASSVGTAQSGQAWVAGNAVVGISSEKVYLPSGSIGDVQAEARAADVVGRVRFTFGASGGTVTIYLRWQNSSNYILLNCVKDTGSADFVQSVKRVAAASTQIGSSAAGFALGGTHEVVVVAKANVYLIYVDGVLKGTHTDAGSALVDQTRVGFGFSASDTASRILQTAFYTVTPVDADTVAALPDLSQSALPQTMYQPTVSLRPTWRAAVRNGLGIVRYDGTDDYLTSQISASNASFTAFMIVNPTAGANRTIIGSDGNGGLSIRVNANGSVAFLAANVQAIGTTAAGAVTFGQWSLITVAYDGATGKYLINVNGRPVKADLRVQAFTAGRFLQLGVQGTTTEPFAGDMGDVLLYDRFLLGDQIARLTKALAAKWAITLQPPLRLRATTIANRTIKGCNIHPRTVDLGATTWRNFWNAWPWDSWIKPCVDLAAAQGANTIRLIGDIDGIVDGTIPLNTYLARISQLADYLKTKGMLLYFCGGALNHMGQATPTQVASHLVSTAQRLATHTNVLGMDLLNEPYVSYGDLGDVLCLGYAARAAQAVKAAVPGLPLSCSEIGKPPAGFWGAGGRQSDYARISRLDPWLDFYDVHLYDPTTSSLDLAPLLSMSSKPVIIGEFGVDRTVVTDSPTRVAFYDAVRSIVNSNDRVIGACNWAIANDGYGLYAENLTERTEMTGAFAQFPAV